MNSIANSRPQIGHGIWGASRFVARRPPTRPADGPSKLLLEASEVIADADGGAVGAATAQKVAGEPIGKCQWAGALGLSSPRKSSKRRARPRELRAIIKCAALAAARAECARTR